VTTTAQRLENRIEQAKADGRREAIAEILAMADHAASLWPVDEYPAMDDDWRKAEGAVIRQTYRNFAGLLTALLDADA
jgi:hypothetical protein